MSSTPRVVEAGIRQFVAAYERYEASPPALGALVVVREGPWPVYGVVADVASGPLDPSRPLDPRGVPGQSAADVLADNPEVTLLLRTRVTVVCCGHARGEVPTAALAPSPAPLLALVEPAGAAETATLMAGGAPLALLVASPLCDDAVITAVLRQAATAFELEAAAFRVAAGKELARLLRADPARLTTIIRGLVP
jgi:hypothetical protein